MAKARTPSPRYRRLVFALALGVAIAGSAVLIAEDDPAADGLLSCGGRGESGCSVFSLFFSDPAGCLRPRPGP